MILLTIYLLIALFLYFFAKPIISGGNIETEFYLKNYFNKKMIQAIGAVLWLPIFLHIVLRNK